MKFLIMLGGLWWVTGFLFRKSFHMLHVCPVFAIQGKVS
jgi:hypothetical protein